MFAFTYAFLKWSDKFKQVFDHLIAYGPLGLFGIVFLDSALIPLPGGPDAAMILLTAQRPDLMPLLVLAGVAGSVLGCLVMYGVARRAGGAALKRFSPRKQARVKDLLDRYDMFAVAGACLAPPPFPFKLFVISSGVLRLNPLKFALGIALGRGVRFALEGWLVVRYGPQIKVTIDHYAREAGLVMIVLLALAAVFFITRSYLKSRRQPLVEDELPSVEQAAGSRQ